MGSERCRQMIWQECNEPQKRKVYYKAKRSSFRSRINYTYTKTSTQPRKTQNTCAFKYDFENVKNDSKMEPTSSQNGSKMSKMAPKWSIPGGLRMDQKASRWFKRRQDGLKEAPRSPRWRKEDPRCHPKDPRWTQEGPRWALKGPRWPQEDPRWPLKDPRWSQDGPKMVPKGFKRSQNGC